MSEYIHLVGAETVQHAANSMGSAAETMKRAAGEIDDTFQRQRMWLEDWLQRFENVLIEDRHKRGMD